LAFDVSKHKVDELSPTDDIVDDNLCVCIVVNRDATLLGWFLPDAINVVNEVDEGCRPISWPKRHDCVGLFDGIDPLEGKLLLTSKSKSKLVVTHQCVKHPASSPLAKLVVYS
jgi:hypothetical protein